MNKEVWKPIPGYEGLYEVSSYGRVKSIATQKTYLDGFRSTPQRIMKPHVINGGYLQLMLTHSHIRKAHLVHRLVAESFIENPQKFPQVNHIDGDKLNNRVENLEWCTAKENMAHSVLYGIRTDTKPVVMLTKSGELVRAFPSIHEAERQTKIWRSNIKECLKHSHKSAGGYIWRYQNEVARND